MPVCKYLLLMGELEFCVLEKVGLGEITFIALRKPHGKI